MDVVGIRFKEAGKIYYFSANNFTLNFKDKVIVESSNGLELAEIVLANIDIDQKKFDKPLSPVIRKANERDLEIYRQNLVDSKEAIKIAQEKANFYNLKMKIVDSEFSFDRTKITFYFTADKRVDFRSLVKDLATIFRNRIELRQIGVRDHAKLKGFHGTCGQKSCCARFMTDFSPLSIKMAKDQGITLDPAKISGVCGRLMCCLSFEEDNYLKAKKYMPKPGTMVETADGIGMVLTNDFVKEICKVRVKLEDDEEIEEYYKACDLVKCK
ncbi:stage 0 sporulation family protein [uncultured Anaerococcus sp.]|uniref:PSP1 domain-containing protein n=1 Tax=uncultured Anaerococcus sp. TaxID=293428 RepID=UPI00288AC8A7|nr:stage 0 sporulation family protein [uncultured Anaerococcus sp.]